MYTIVRLHRQFYIYMVFFVLILVSSQIIVKVIDLSFFSKNPNWECPNEPIDVVYTWVNGSDPKFLEELSFYSKLTPGNIDSSRKRFEDKNELKFSLRSLEKYAPWVNHVYIVTNGQIPQWLDLDYEKVTLVTHEEIFKDKSNLPTFSSPAIESNLHRIPELSEKFIYFNDDIFLGQPIYRDDFYTPSKGYLIYLAWPISPCSWNCPWVYVNDGSCDPMCNNFNCQYDGDDCLVSNTEIKQILSSNKTNLQLYNQELPDSLFNFISNSSDPLTNSSENQKNNINRNLTDTNSKNFMSVLTSHENHKSLKNYSRIIEKHNSKILYTNKLKRNRKKRSLASDAKPTSNLDAFSVSLQHTNRVLNRKFGFKTRKVPSHAPILIEKSIMGQLQEAFVAEFKTTEMNRFRRANDMQFSLSYYYFVMSQTLERTLEDIFDEFDSDLSGTWSDRELRNLLAKLYDIPLTYETVDEFESILINCSEDGHFSEVSTPPYERYIDSRLPTISKELVIGCSHLSSLLRSEFGVKPKYKYEIKKTSEQNIYVTFAMLKSNISHTVIDLDKIRRKRSKFICLNDNLDESKTGENDLVRAILYDFYISLFPQPSKFELPENSRNRFLYVSELDEWRLRHFQIKVILFFVLSVLLCSTFFNMCKKKCLFLNKCCF